MHQHPIITLKKACAKGKTSSDISSSKKTNTQGPTVHADRTPSIIAAKLLTPSTQWPCLEWWKPKDARNPSRWNRNCEPPLVLGGKPSVICLFLPFSSREVMLAASGFRIEWSSSYKTKVWETLGWFHYQCQPVVSRPSNNKWVNMVNPIYPKSSKNLM